jgi:hypothetical protein
MSHRNVTKVVWCILVQSSGLQVSGHWLLATGGWHLVLGLYLLVTAHMSLATSLWISQEQEASSQVPDTRNLKPKIRLCLVNYVRDATIETIESKGCLKKYEHCL